MGSYVTGLGAVTPLGNSVPETWNGMVEGRSGITSIKSFDTGDCPVTIGGEIRDFEPTHHMPPTEVRRMDPYAQYAVAAAHQALEQAGVTPGVCPPERLCVLVGSGYGTTKLDADGVRVFDSKGARAVRPYLSAYAAIDIVTAYLSMELGAMGESFAVSAACASGTVVIGEAHRLIERGDADIVVAVGAENSMSGKDLALTAATRALTSRFNDNPSAASRPFDRQRDGFVLSSGAGAVVLESAESVRRRGATPLAEIAGYGAASDAHHITAPHPEGLGARFAMRRALAAAGVPAGEVDYINAHGTSTQLNDRTETFAIQAELGDRSREIPVSSTKSTTGHMIGAAGAVELIACVKALETGWVPPTVNCDDPEFPEMNFVANKAQQHTLRVAMSNSFGFGGHNAVLVVKAC
ncbi:beta-ketoacyl-[acyl-carrier-protein] synthase family protein [Streptomyces scabiei]|uniref:3-oxoacyl-[acyl-carrier-protein] synthase 2 n=1 Tax=Streptomyces scabiei TaxID=1930 RepID=A0A100JLU6_STRSC|nr:beta-ketoacyl-ACP synthase II [Streptomyces scabiei]GAQ61812.1 3-oxoacyl-[acyl-carrier-protein] synthase 2 [Streptomyces scabiei]